MPAELKILIDVAWYRLRRFEMANLGAAMLIMLALRLPVFEIVARLVFGALLNLFVYLNNDYLDVEDDAASPTKAGRKVAYLQNHKPQAMRAQLGLLGLLSGFAVVWGGGLLAALALGAGVCWIYSAKLKRMPFVDVLAMIVWGVAMPMVAVPPGHADGWWLLAQLGLFSGVFETVQVMRDHDEDARLGIRTTAVALGVVETKWLGRALLVASGVFAALVFHPLLVAGPVAAAFLPVHRGAYDRYWNRIRLALGGTFLLECAIVYFAGG
jgi:4-hydroxybenzoate polyprenyltransferase